MKKHLFLLLLPAMALLLHGCKDKTEYCPAYPQEDTDYLPVDFVGQSLSYVFDDDTVVLKVEAPEFSEKHERGEIFGEICEPEALMFLRADNDFTVQYLKRYSAQNHNHFDIYTYFRLGQSFWSTHSKNYDKTTLLSNWTSPNGTTYADVWRSLEDRGVNGTDTSYFSRQKGLLYYRSTKHYCLLLP